MYSNKKLKEQVVSGLFWKFGERIFAQGVSFIVSLILARLLLPEQYGIVALVLVFINLANVFVTNGLGESLIQKKDSNSTDFSTIFYCSVGFSIVLYIILFFLAPLIANFYNNQDLILVLRILSFQVPLSAIKTIQQAYVSKHMLFKKFFFSTIGGTLFSGVVGIIMAYNGFGVWALVAQYLVNSSIDTLILFITVEWRPTLQFSSKSAKQLIGYGWKLVLSQFINTFYSELRSLFIGKVYTTADLAAYNKGNQFPSLLITNINSSISSVLFPVMSKTSDDRDKLKELTRQSIKLSSYILFPMLAGLAVVAEPLIRLLLTENWLPCVPFLQISCIFWMFQPSQTANVQAIKAAGRSDICLKLEVIKKIIGVALLLVTINISVYAVVIANAIFAGISAIINIFPNKRLIGYGIKEQVVDLLPSLALSTVMFLISLQVIVFGFNDILTIFLQFIIGCTIYILGSWIFKIDSFKYICETLNKFLNIRNANSANKEK